MPGLKKGEYGKTVQYKQPNGPQRAESREAEVFMKYVVFLGDGMADQPLEQLGGRTPLEVARKPHLDELARSGLTGMVRTVPPGMKPGSDNANLSVLGYDPLTCYTGRSPLEAVSMGVELQEGDVTYRCNLVTLSEDLPFEDKIMLDYSGGEISTPEAEALIRTLSEAFDDEKRALFPGVSYRHCLRWRGAVPGRTELTPPHDISDRPIGGFLPKGENAGVLEDLMRRSFELLKDHPVNAARRARGQRPANCCWFWGEGTKPKLPAFREKTGLSGVVISAVDLVKGIGLLAGMEVIEVEGATGNLDTNFRGKGEAAVRALRDHDFVYIHMEAPDECGHHGDAAGKIRAIELIDELVVGPVTEALQKLGPVSVMALPDHATPLARKTHTAEPVPFLIWRSTAPRKNPVSGYSEREGEKSGILIEPGCTLMDLFLKGR